MTRVRLSRIFWIGAAAIIVAAALVALTAILRGDFSETDGRIIGTLAAVLLAGGTLVVGLALRERRPGSPVALATIAIAPIGFALVEYAIWDFVFDGGGEDQWRVGWTGMIGLGAGLMASAALLFARAPRIVQLAYASAVLVLLAAVVSIVAVWSENPGGTEEKILAALWILASLGLVLTPILERFVDADTTAAGAARVLATLDDVELVATRVGPGLDVQLAPGERLALRRRDRPA